MGVRVGGALTARKQHMTEHDDGDECVNGQLDEALWSPRRALWPPALSEGHETGRMGSCHLEECARRFARVVRALHDLLQVRPNCAAERGERDPRLAPKQCSAEVALQLDNAIGQRRLRDAALLGRAREIQLLRERQEIANLKHFHKSPWSAGFADDASRHQGMGRAPCVRRMPLWVRAVGEPVHRRLKELGRCRVLGAKQKSSARSDPKRTLANLARYTKEYYLGIRSTRI